MGTRFPNLAQLTFIAVFSLFRFTVGPFCLPGEWHGVTEMVHEANDYS
jgi:hypothetical protein